jgi:hypothetical protein
VVEFVHKYFLPQTHKPLILHKTFFLHVAPRSAKLFLLREKQPATEVPMASTKTANYTDEMLLRILDMYEKGGNEAIPDIAQAFNKSERSIRSKLVREGVYVASPKSNKAKREDGPSKKDLLNELEAIAPFGVNGFMGATKEAIASVIAFVKAAQA